MRAWSCAACGDFSYAVRRRGSAASWPYAILCPALMLLPRLVDLSALAGSLICLKRGEDDAGF